MKICFVCSSLERGRDGVGDYTRLLAEELERQGAQCAIIALNDIWVEHVAQGECEVRAFTEPLGIPVLRCSSSTTWSRRVRASKSFLDDFNPEWVSLQMVCYGFDGRGFVYELANKFIPSLQPRRVHLMLHELWLGEHDHAPIKEKLIGMFQRYWVLKLVKRVSRAAAVHTSNQGYAFILKKRGFSAKVLPLFGAVPLTCTRSEGWLFRQTQTASCKGGNREWLIGFFGTLHPVWPAEPLFTYLERAAKITQREIVLVSIGRLGPGEPLWLSLAERYRAKFRFLRLGEQPPEHIADFLNSIDFGVATTPYTLIGKSATAAAMVEHGVPLIVNRDDVQFRGYVPDRNKLPALIVKMDEELPQRMARMKRESPQAKLPEIAREFLLDLGCRACVPSNR